MSGGITAQPQTAGYAFLSTYDTGLDALGITLKLGLNGISLPLFVMAGIVGLRGRALRHPVAGRAAQDCT
jgi:NADH:ubiquinone oxidoreductase subunit 4 (subunit M)